MAAEATASGTVQFNFVKSGAVMGVSRFVAALGLVLFAVTLPHSASAQSNEIVEYYGLDQVGSIRVVFDPQGAIKTRRDYAPFGEEVTSVTADPKVYAQLFRDEESKLDYAQARMYQSRTGRFLSPDPVFAGGINPQGWNRYAYALSNPISVTDASGLCPEALCFDWGTVNVFGGPPIPLRGAWSAGSDDLILALPDDAGFQSSGSVGGSGLVTTVATPPVVSPPVQTPPTPTPGPPETDETTGECASRVAGNMSLASMGAAVLPYNADGFFAQAFLGNDFASAIDLGVNVATAVAGWGGDVNAKDVGGFIVSNPTPFNATVRGGNWVMKQRVGGRNTADYVSTRDGGIEVKGWLRDTPVAKTLAGRGLGLVLKGLSTPKLVYDAATYAGSLAYCAAR